MSTYYETGQRVQEALRNGETLRVELNDGTWDLCGIHLAEEWHMLAPGERFRIIDPSRCDDCQEIEHDTCPLAEGCTCCADTAERSEEG